MRIQERYLEDVLVDYPELIEPGLVFIKRQITLNNTKQRIDLHFKDRHGNDLFVELKRRRFKYHDIGQILNYYKALKHAQDPNVRLLVIATSFNLEAQRLLRYLGVELKRVQLPSKLEELYTQTKLIPIW